MMQSTIKKMTGAWGLGLEIAKADFRLRNEGRYLGILWYLLNPILTFALLFLIFSSRLGSGIPAYPLYLLLGVIMFNFFQSATLESTRAIIQENAHLIKSINFKREALIIAIVLRNLFSHLFEIILFAIVLWFYHVNLLWMLCYIPILAVFLIFILGSSLILSSLTVFFTDLDNIWSFAVKLIWLGTPIFYAIESQARLAFLNLFNPLYYFLSVARDVIIYHRAPGAMLIYGIVSWSVAAIIIGYLIFNSLKLRMAESI